MISVYISDSHLYLNVLQTVSDEVKDEDPEEDISDVSSPVSQPTISLLSPKAMEMAGRIIKFEEEQREKAKVRHDDSLLSHLKSHKVNFNDRVSRKC